MFLQFVINGLITGVLYSLLAIGFALVYNTTKIFHIASVAIYVVAAYTFWFFSSRLEISMLFAGLIANAVTMIVSLGTDILVYRPLKRKNSSLSVAMIASIGVMTVVVNLVALLFGNGSKALANTFYGVWTVAGVQITRPQMIQFIMGGVVLVCFLFFLHRTSWGIRLRAISCDDALYETLGYDVDKTRNVVFLLSGLFIALSSCLMSLGVGLDPHMGMNVLINAMVAMIIGGSGRLEACILGGILLGIAQSLVLLEFSASWQNAMTFILLLIFLFVRPQGIAGYKRRVI